MKKIIVGFIIGLTLALAVNTYAFRVESPPKLKVDNPSSVIQINGWLEDIWHLTNGRYVPNVVSTIPTKAAEEGATKIYSSGGVYRVYRYLNGDWRYWNFDG